MSENARNRTKPPRRRVRKSGTLDDLKRVCWQSLTAADLLLRRSEDRAEILRAISAISTAGGVYARLLENERQAESDALRVSSIQEVERILDATLEVVLRAVEGEPLISRQILEGVRSFWQITEHEK